MVTIALSACCSAPPRETPVLTLAPPPAPVTIGAQTSPHTGLDITQVDLASYAKSGRFVIEADFFGADGKQAYEPDVVAVELRADGAPLATDFAATTYGRAGQPVAFAMLLPMHASYASDDAEIEPPTRFTARVAEGYAAILDAATPGSSVSVWAYHSDDALRVVDFASDTRHVADELRGVRAAARDGQLAPQLYAALGKVVANFETTTRPLPTRRVLLVVSDGIDRNTATSTDRLVGELVERISAQHLETRFIGFTAAMPEPLVPFAQIATSTRGHYHFVPFEQYPDLAKHVADLGRAINGRLVIELTPKAPLVVTSALDVIVTLRDGAQATGRLVVAGLPQ